MFALSLFEKCAPTFVYYFIISRVLLIKDCDGHWSVQEKCRAFDVNM